MWLFIFAFGFLVVVPEANLRLPHIIYRALYHRPRPRTMAVVTFAHVAPAPASVKHYSYALSTV